MKIAITATVLLFCSVAFAQKPHANHPTSHASSSRPYYSGTHHTTSHGGTYRGETNASSHKGGHYTNPRTQNQYGRHK